MFYLLGLTYTNILYKLIKNDTATGRFEINIKF